MNFQFYLFGFFFLFCLFCFLMPSAANHSKTKEFNLLPDTEVSCEETQTIMNVCFKHLPLHSMEFLERTNLSAKNVEIESKCKNFKHGMQCFDNYTRRCFSEGKLVHWQNNSSDARRFIENLCGDRMHEAEYLQTRECFNRIQEDWKKCAKEFKTLLVDEFHGSSHSMDISSKYMQFCCARHAYESCIYSSAHLKCFNHSTEAGMLLEEKQFSDCQSYMSSAAPRTLIKLTACFVLVSFTVSMISKHL